QGNMVAGAKLTAFQTYAGVTSPPSVEVTLQTALSVDAPTLTAPLLECAQCVLVDGLLPGVNAQVRDRAATLGQSTTCDGAVQIDVAPPLMSAHLIPARQVYCGNPGPDSPGFTVGMVREPRLSLAAPEVADPLFECQQSCIVEGCMPGCQVELLV